MWIKYKLKSIYFSVFFRMLLAGIVSSLCFQIFLSVSTTLIISQKEKAFKEFQIQVEQFATYMQDEITQNKITFASASKVDWKTNEKQWEYYLTNKSISESLEDKSWFFVDDSFVHPLYFADVEGYLIIYPLKGDIAADIYYLLSGLAAISIFVILSFLFLSKVFSYIKDITYGVSIIGKGNLEYDIPMRYNNELTELAVGINNMRNQLYIQNKAEKEAEQRQRMLITNMSHDLRTPLTSLIGYIGLIKTKLKSQTEIYEYCCVVEKNSLRLEKSINDLFMYTKITSNDIALNLIKVNPNLLLRQIIELQIGEIQFTTEIEKTFITVDIEYFQRITNNLFDNIRKYGVQETPTIIKLCQDDDYVIISVENNTDIDLENKIKFLAQRTYMAQAERNGQSTGLGLSIVSELMNLMNGKVHIQFEKPKFTILLYFPKSK